MLMKVILLTLIFGYFVTLNAQVFQKPVGCYAGTNGTNPTAMAHPESRGVLVTDSWQNIETSPGVFDFSALNAKINTVKSAGLKYSLGIPAGAFGSPSWLIDSLNASFLPFTYQSQSEKLPIWWDSVVQNRLHLLVNELGNNYANDTSLSHVYISQMTTNGLEGHLNGVDMTAFTSSGFTNQKWIDAALTTSYVFANNFPSTPIVFEVHEINHDTTVPAAIINQLYQDASLCKRVGLAMWWISGKTDYQSNLVHFIEHFNGDKYAQVIGRSDQPERFKDSLYSTVFTQAKTLGIRYIEPWPYEFQHHTYDSLFTDFNAWADTVFSPYDTCQNATTLITNKEANEVNISVYPNPFNYSTAVTTQNPSIKITSLSIYNLAGKLISYHTPNNSIFQFTNTKLPQGVYLLKITLSNGQTINKKVLRE